MKRASVVVFPELTLVVQRGRSVLQDPSKSASPPSGIAAATADCSTVAIVGALRSDSKLYNAAVAIARGENHAAWLADL